MGVSGLSKEKKAEKNHVVQLHTVYQRILALLSPELRAVVTSDPREASCEGREVRNLMKIIEEKLIQYTYHWTKMQMRFEFRNLYMEEETPFEFAAKVEKASRQVSRVGYNPDEDEKVMVFLSGLKAKYARGRV